MILLGRDYDYESPENASVLVSYEYMSQEGLIHEDYKTCYVATANPAYSYTKDHKILWVKQGVTDYNEMFEVLQSYTKKGYRVIHNPQKDMSIPQTDHWHLVLSLESVLFDEFCKNQLKELKMF